ncbi:MAG: hypothetical protein ACTHLV_10450, partial [Achromobacter mucicolens]
MSPALLRLYLQARRAVVASGVAPEGCVHPVMPPPPHACSLSRCHAFEQLVRLKSNLIGEIGFHVDPRNTLRPALAGRHDAAAPSCHPDFAA